MSIVNGKITVNGQYGISIYDLRKAFNSTRVDLLAIIMEDSGVPDAGADPADYMTGPNGEKVYTAFALSGWMYNENQEKWKRTADAVPLKSGWTLSDAPMTGKPAGSVDYRKGDLIYGRHPKWKLWAGGFNIGKMVVAEGTNLYYMRYNIFMNPWTNGAPLPSFTGFWPTGYTVPAGNRPSGHIPDLFAFQGYDGENKAPSFQFDAADKIEWHNGVPEICNDDNTLRCRYYMTENYPIIGDMYRLFHHNPASTDIGSSLKVALGNLADWWLPASLMKRSGETDYGRTIAYHAIYGAYGEMAATPHTSPQQTPEPFGKAWSVEETPLSRDSSPAVVSKYRDGEGTWKMILTQYLYRILWNEYMYGGYPAAGSEASIDCDIRVYPVKSPNTTDTETGLRRFDINPPQISDLVNLEWFLEPLKAKLTGKIDPYVVNSDRRRFIIYNDCKDVQVSPTYRGERDYSLPYLAKVGNQTPYIWPMHGTSGYYPFVSIDEDRERQKDYIYFQYAVWNYYGEHAALHLAHVADFPMNVFWEIVCCDTASDDGHGKGKVISRYKGFKAASALQEGADAYGWTTAANATYLPTGHIDTGSEQPFGRWSPDSVGCKRFEYVYLSYVEKSELCPRGMQSSDFSLDSVTAMVRIAPANDGQVYITLLNQWPGVVNYDPKSDSFTQRSNTGGTTYEWYFQDYNSILTEEGTAYRFTLFGQLCTITLNSQGKEVRTALTSLPEDTFDIDIKNENGDPVAAWGIDSETEYGESQTDYYGNILTLSREDHPHIDAETGVAMFAGEVFKLDMTIQKSNVSGRMLTVTVSAGTMPNS